MSSSPPLGDDVIDALGGNDVICALGGDDTIRAGGGTDTLVFAGPGVIASLVTGTASGQGTDTLSGVENLTGGPGSDTLTAGIVAAVLDGAGGNDTVVSGSACDRLVGGPGLDTATFPDAAPVRANVATQSATGQGTDALVGIENLTGGNGGDTLTGDDAVNVLNGRGGNDLCDARAGNDRAFECDRGVVTLAPAGSTDTYA